MSDERVKLAGVVSPTGTEGFCVPVFTERGSNHLLVQVIGLKGQIEAFEPIDDQLPLIQISQSVSRAIGEPGFWYFMLGAQQSLYGSVDEIRSAVPLRKGELQQNAYVYLQVATVCGLQREEVEAIKKVRKLLVDQLGRSAAESWLDANVLSPTLRVWLNQSNLPNVPRSDLRLLSRGAHAITIEGTTTLVAPESLVRMADGQGWSRLVDRFSSLLRDFELHLGDMAYVDDAGLLVRPKVLQLKREAVAAFGKAKGTSFHQVSKSYFESDTAGTRVVCTFSSRYEGKGKRKYWYGFHEIWNRWLDEAQTGYVLLGCLDARRCFALPLAFVRKQLPSLRSTGSGRDRYWHLDVVDIDGASDRLDIPGLRRSLPLSEFAFEF